MATLEAWRPTAADVAALIPERTGAENEDGTLETRGTFDADTTPTATQVDGLVRGVQSEVVSVVGTMPAALTLVPPGGTIGESPAGHVVALGTAALVESGFFPDSQLGVESPAGRLEARYRTALAALVKAANELSAGVDPGDTPKASGAFPATVPLGLATTPWEPW